MIRHDAIGQQPATGEIFIHPQKNPELLPLRIPKHKPPIHHPRNAVVNRRFHQRLFPRDQPSRTTHAPTLSQSPLMARRILIICLSPSHTSKGQRANRLTDEPLPLKRLADTSPLTASNLSEQMAFAMSSVASIGMVILQKNAWQSLHPANHSGEFPRYPTPP